MAATPCLVTPMKWWEWDAAWHASTATPNVPSVPFLKPIGKDRPDASSLCSWDSVVLAPMAPKESRSARYCGEMVSSISEPIGTPVLVKFTNSCLALCRPLLMLKVLLTSGSLINPFQPTVVLGFSRYALITMHRSFCSSSDSFFSLCAYSCAASRSCTEQGPTITSTRSSRPVMISMDSFLPRLAVWIDTSVAGTCTCSSAGDTSGS